jgi:predicted flap endonuclease-1-like 5' DNA nuclease
MPRIVDLTSLQPEHVTALKHLGVHSTDSLLRKAATSKARGRLARQTGIPEPLIDRWVNMADLMRVNGLGESYCHLLMAAGIHRLEDLRAALPEQLHDHIESLDDYQQWVGRIPSARKIRSWINASRRLPTVIDTVA